MSAKSAPWRDGVRKRHHVAGRVCASSICIKPVVASSACAVAIMYNSHTAMIVFIKYLAPHRGNQPWGISTSSNKRRGSDRQGDLHRRRGVTMKADRRLLHVVMAARWLEVT